MTIAKHSCEKCYQKESPCGNCCKNCSDCPHCYDIDIEKMREYLFAIDEKISAYNESSLCMDDWGYGCKPVNKDSYEKLLLFRGYIEKYYKAQKFNYSVGICPNEIQKVLENTSQLITLNHHSCEDFSYVNIDDSNYEEWIINNPYCIAWEDWELHIVNIYPKIGFKVSDITNSCKLIYDIKGEQLLDIPKLLYTLSVASIAQDKDCLDITLDSKLKNCEFNYNPLAL